MGVDSHFSLCRSLWELPLANRKVQVVKLHGRALIPTFAHPTDSGMDLSSAEKLVLKRGQRRLVRTGLAVRFPKLTEGQIRPRSGLALKYGVTVLNAPGTIDEGYSGEISVLLINLGASDFTVKTGMKIAQLVVSPRIDVRISEVKSFRSKKRSTRGSRGFGSTGMM
ncbi:dUTP diphosphatase [Bradyrhizobium sp. RP6]|uniref:dUTP diphosphatase n=1 Tax=Bradyrhizobium sp. RP6 TaxID=2489596 RepID=UPI000F54A4E0|nr:dUTP diphosphatase [Bradyrhizobium sp. RP6]RQH12744.1 dUTP diphosphatase [Bradyrhizobium sp. RP6]